MININFFELLVVLAVVLIVVKPEDIPSLLKKMGQIVSKIQKQLAGLKQEVEGHNGTGLSLREIAEQHQKNMKGEGKE